MAWWEIAGLVLVVLLLAVGVYGYIRSWRDDEPRYALWFWGSAASVVLALLALVGVGVYASVAA